MNRNFFVRWMREIYPRWSLLLLFFGAILAIYLAVFLPILLTWYVMRDSGLSFNDVFEILETRTLKEPSISEMFLGIGGALFGIYGVCRAVAYLPIWNSNFMRMLYQSPWTNRQKIPFGSITLKAQDVLVLSCGLFCTAPLLQWNVVYLVFAFLAGYLLLMLNIFWVLKQWKDFFTLAFGVGFAWISLALMPVWCTALLFCVLYCFSSAGTTRLLERLGNRESYKKFATLAKHNPKQEGYFSLVAFGEEPKAKIGWPFDDLAPHPLLQNRNIVREIIWSVLISWIYFAIFYTASNLKWDSQGDQHSFLSLLITGTLTVPFVFITYFLHQCLKNGLFPPIRPWGRLTFKRLIVPSYDRIFIAPIYALVYSIALCVLLFNWKIEPIIIGTTILATSLLICFLGSPSFEKWKLTARCRIQPVASTDSNQIKSVEK